MIVDLIEQQTGKPFSALIGLAHPSELEKLESWNFNWSELSKTDGSIVFKISRKEDSDIIEGLVMITLLNNKSIYMDNLEIAPHNLGRKGKFRNVAGCLIAFACKQSFDLGKDEYLGFVSFSSKTALIAHYRDKYGATQIFNQKMFINPTQGKRLVKDYLQINI